MTQLQTLTLGEHQVHKEQRATAAGTYNAWLVTIPVQAQVDADADRSWGLGQRVVLHEAESLQAALDYVAATEATAA